MATNDIPVLVKRVTMAMVTGKGIAFPAALDIARASLTKQGYLASGSDRGPVTNIKLTAKGAQRNREHMRKPMRESIAFDRLFTKYGPRLGGVTAPEK